MVLALSVAEFQGSFTPMYYSYMQSLGQVETAQHVLQITQETATVMQAAAAITVSAAALLIAFAAPVIAAGTATMAYGSAMMSSAAAWGPFGIAQFLAGSIIWAAGAAVWLAGTYTVTAATIMVAGAAATVSAANAMVAQAAAQVAMNQVAALVVHQNTVNSSSANSALKIRKAEDEYLKAQAELDYFTKVKDMKTLKERMIQWGASHDDDMDQDAGTAEDDGITEDLYLLTEEDLAYLSEGTTFTSSSGEGLDVSSKVSSNKLDVASEKKEAEFADAFGLHYDPDTLTTTQPGPLSEGAYVDGMGNRWTRVLTLNHDGTLTTKYARLVNNTGKYGATEEKREGYDMGRILQMLVDHGADLRSESKEAYLAAGNDVVANGGDMGFVLRERDQTIGAVYEQAGGDRDGGYEYTGYSMAMADYADNTTAILNMELEQKASLQRKEWDLRGAELAHSRQEWEDKMAAILNRGRKGWIASEDRFLAEWRKWTKEYDREVEEGIDEWERKIDQHFTDKAAWEDKIRKTTTEANIADVMGSAIDALNKQLEAAAENLKVSFNGVNKLRAIDDMIAEVRSKDPAGVERTMSQ